MCVNVLARLRVSTDRMLLTSSAAVDHFFSLLLYFTPATLLSPKQTDGDGCFCGIVIPTCIRACGHDWPFHALLHHHRAFSTYFLSEVMRAPRLLGLIIQFFALLKFSPSIITLLKVPTGKMYNIA